ncbi:MULTISPECIES: bacillithiol biosynthesis cysteine-adding enzyme BshC [Thermoactinomyces]|uniref:bacillithiol biosynthesis cysteine-adding enzyme BshC n=1 Tax=Thermoactinomyces TaxID=2023 RepID=UPI0009E3AE46|nr:MULTISPECIES: bacillithiol biosynthesis cysteine-adding enzyme BshC [Thermoactinomyces]QCV55166.1 bacillithiol biosynthesis cysteine-adding enzyme BshC [Thermoactinomyces vulgaris]
MRLQKIAMTKKSSIFDEFLHDREFAGSFYQYHPWQEESIYERARDLKTSKPAVSRQELVRVLRSYHQPDLLHPEVERNLNRLAKEDSMVVIGGQQAGLLGGPLYTFYKAITIIRLAKQAEEQLGQPVIPVFWIAGEDHDLEEVNHVWVQNGEKEPVKHRFAVKDQRKIPISRRRLDEKQYRDWLDQLAKILPDRPYKEEWLAQCQKWGIGTRSWTRLFAKVFHHFFGPYGLLLVDSHDENLRRLEVPVFKSMIRQSQAIARAVQNASGRLAARGLEVPVDLKKDQGNLFIQVDDERQLLFQKGGQWTTKDGLKKWSEDELMSLVEQEPALFSNNVITRPLMQEALFPTLYFVAGPGEIAYWSLLKEAFYELGLKMPIVIPRVFVTVMDPALEKRMDEFALGLEELDNLNQKKLKWIDEQQPPDLTDRFQEAVDAIIGHHEQLVGYLHQTIGMNMREIGKKNEEKIKAQIDYLHRFAKKSLEEKHRASLRKWDELIHGIYPNDKPQERVYNMIWAWNEHGMDWVDFLLRAPSYEVRLDGSVHVLLI